LLKELASRLNAFAVLAFCAEITRLPGHCAALWFPEKATAHTTPSRFTTVAHIWLLRPLVSACTAAASAVLSWFCVGNPRQSARWAPSESARVTGTASPRQLAKTPDRAILTIIVFFSCSL
jgi:integral membrane sensor domain MASE1